jgi:hypothetical protein
MQLSRLGQMKHQLDATLCRFYFCRVTVHVLGASAHHAHDARKHKIKIVTLMFYETIK